MRRLRDLTWHPALFDERLGDIEFRDRRRDVGDFGRAVIAFIEGEPAPKKRPRFNTKTGHAMTPGATREAEGRIAWEVKAQNGAAFGEPPYFPKGQDVRVTLAFGSSRKADATIGVPDLDNLIKLVLDALNGLVWADDRQVVAIEATVHRGEAEPWTHIRVDCVP